MFAVVVVVVVIIIIIITFTTIIIIVTINISTTIIISPRGQQLLIHAMQKHKRGPPVSCLTQPLTTKP
jgi:hypothetical protein